MVSVSIMPPTSVGPPSRGDSQGGAGGKQADHRHQDHKGQQANKPPQPGRRAVHLPLLAHLHLLSHPRHYSELGNKRIFSRAAIRFILNPLLCPTATTIRENNKTPALGTQKHGRGWRRGWELCWLCWPGTTRSASLRPMRSNYQSLTIMHRFGRKRNPGPNRR